MWLLWRLWSRRRGAPTWSAAFTEQARLDAWDTDELADEDTALLLLGVLVAMSLLVGILVWPPGARIGHCATVTLYTADDTAAVEIRDALTHRFPHTTFTTTTGASSWTALRNLNETAGRCALGVGPMTAQEMWSSPQTGMRLVGSSSLTGPDDWLFVQARADPALADAVTRMLSDAARRRGRVR